MRGKRRENVEGGGGRERERGKREEKRESRERREEREGGWKESRNV